MKVSNIILTTALILTVTGMLVSNLILKSEYNKVDKNDPYWTYGKIQDQPFKHLNITGGNITNISFEQSPHSSVKVLKSWRGYHDSSLKTYVKQDTLFVMFSNRLENLPEKFWLMRMIPVRIFCPELLSITGFDTRITLDKFNRNNLQVSLSGTSRLLVNSYRRKLDTLAVTQRDSSQTVIAMSRDIRGSAEMDIKEVLASGEGTSQLDLKTAEIGHLQLKIADSAAIFLSGSSLKRWKQ